MSLAERLETAARAIPQNQEIEGSVEDTTEDTGLDLVDEMPDVEDILPHDDDDDASTSEGGPDGDVVGPPDVGSGTSRGPERPETVSRLIGNMRVKERELAEERQARRVEQQELLRLRNELATHQSDGGPSADPVEAMWSAALREFGVRDRSDPRVLGRFREMVVDATAEAYPDESALVDGLRDRVEARRRTVKERERFREYDDRITAMERERLQYQERAQEAQLQTSAVQFLAANVERLPFLNAAAEAGDVVPEDIVVRTARRMVDEGVAPDPKDMKQLADLYGVIAGNLEAHYQNVAEAFDRRTSAAQSSTGPLGNRNNAQRPRTVQRVPPTQAGGATARQQQPKPRNPRGGGGRGSAGPNQAPAGDDDGPRDLAARIAHAERLARRR